MALASPIPAGKGAGSACFGSVAGKKGSSSDSTPHTTNNRMELMAPIQGLLALKEPCEVITTDTEYVQLGMTKWISKWEVKALVAQACAVPNADLWIELDELAAEAHLDMDPGPRRSRR
jgi:ribonuclease HI